MIQTQLQMLQDRFSTRTIAIALGAVTLLAAAIVTSAQQATGDAWLAADVTLKTVGIVGMIYGTAWALRRSAGTARWAAAGVKPLRQLDTLSLGNHRAIHVVQAGSRTLVIGATATQLSLLSELAEGDAGLWQKDVVTTPLSFQDALNRLVKPAGDDH